jgi:hypothetical protein
VKVRKVIQRNLQHSGEGVSVASGVNAVVAASVGEADATSVSVSNTQRIVQGSPHPSREEHE